MRILIIEDDPDTASYIKRGVEEAGHVADHAGDGKDGLLMATTEPYDILVVDRMLPEMDGLTLVKAIRASDNTTPVLILSALGEVDDRVQGLKAGADDYLTKPFAFSELLARLEALLRRQEVEAPVSAISYPTLIWAAPVRDGISTCAGWCGAKMGIPIPAHGASSFRRLRLWSRSIRIWFG